MTSPIFGSEYAAVYDALYKNKAYEAEAEYVHHLLRDAGVREGAVVEFGSGTGIHGQLLARAGYRVQGIERSSAMAEASERRAAESGTSWSVAVGDACETRIPGRWDAALALFHVVSYQADDDDLDRLLGNVSAHLRDGGVFLFDVWHAAAVLGIGPSIRVTRVAAPGRRIVRIAEPELLEAQHCVDVHYTLFAETEDGLWKSANETHRMRYFTAEEVREMCAKHGMTIVRAEEWLTGAACDSTTWGVCYVALKSGAVRS